MRVVLDGEWLPRWLTSHELLWGELLGIAAALFVEDG